MSDNYFNFAINIFVYIKFVINSINNIYWPEHPRNLRKYESSDKNRTCISTEPSYSPRCYTSLATKECPIKSSKIDLAKVKFSMNWS